MADVVDMGEVDEIHSKDESVPEDLLTNGEVKDQNTEEDHDSNMEEAAINHETMEVDLDSLDEEHVDGNEVKNGLDCVEEIASIEADEEHTELITNEIHHIEDNTDDEINEIIDDDDDDDEDDEIKSVKSIKSTNENSNDPLSDKIIDNTIELNDSGEVDVVIIDQNPLKENGLKLDTEPTIISDDGDENPTVPMKQKKKDLITPTRRSNRNVHKQKTYIESEKEEQDSEESDIEEILPEDPLAVGDPVRHEISHKKRHMSSSTIVVKDTKRLVEIASKSNPNNSGKKEPTLVIIDTNSILSGRGPVPVVPKQAAPSNYSSVLPMAVPAQGLYPPNMRATITPIPMNTSSSKQIPPSPQQIASQPAILPSLTDDMFVVEAPSFIVPYVYEKPPIKEFREFLNSMAKEIAEQNKEEEKEIKDEKKEEDCSEASKEEEKIDTPKDESKSNSENDKRKFDLYGEESDKKSSCFDSPLCKFFIDIGNNLVQEYVQTDLLKQQKRKRDREQGQNAQTNNTIKSLLKNLEYSKENNEPYKMEMKKCEFCSFKSESALAMAFHLETPHMKNYMYKCNFCPFEVRLPYDILFHMEAIHAVRGRLEKAPAFHQCPNCPFEDNQKGKLSRHLVACIRKFKPEKNLEPPIDWEPPAKIPRVPRMKQSSLSSTAAMYQMAKSSQYQLLSKMTNPAFNRGRGRPTLGTVKQTTPIIRPNPAMIYKQSMSGGSVLVPTNYQLTGNQLYQVIGGHDLAGRLGTGSPMALVPNISAATNSVSMQQQQSATNKKPVHQPSISITPLPRGTTSSSTASGAQSKPGDSNAKNSFVICEICDGYIKDLEQLRNHMQWIHKVKIHPKMIYNRPPLNCQKCQFRFFTDQGLERHLLGSHGLVTSSMQEAANKSKDSGRCPVCGRVYQWKLLNHVARDHNMTLKPAHLSYKCTVCTATFGMYKLFENHVYSAHSVVAKRVMDKKSAAAASSSSKNDTLLKPLKINDEITIIPQQPKSSGASTSKEGSSSSPSIGSSRNSSGSVPSTSKSGDDLLMGLTRAERLARRKSTVDN